MSAALNSGTGALRRLPARWRGPMRFQAMRRLVSDASHPYPAESVMAPCGTLPSRQGQVALLFSASTAATVAALASGASVAHAAAPAENAKDGGTPVILLEGDPEQASADVVAEGAVEAALKTPKPTPVSAPSQPPLAGMPSRQEVAGVRAALNELLDEHEELSPALVGLSWLASATYDAQTGAGGSAAGAARALADGRSDSALDAARVALRRIGGQYPSLSASDLVTLAGAVAVEHMGGPFVKWRPGRVGASREAALPSSSDAGVVAGVDGGGTGLASVLRQVRAKWECQGFTEREAVALLGAVAVFRGYPSVPDDGDSVEGEWSRKSVTFTNEYFRDLVGNTWYLRKWDGPDQFVTSSESICMDVRDMALLWDKRLRKHVEEFAKDEDMFFDAFASAFQKLQENGVSCFEAAPPQTPWYKFW